MMTKTSFSGAMDAPKDVLLPFGEDSAANSVAGGDLHSTKAPVPGTDFHSVLSYLSPRGQPPEGHTLNSKPSPGRVASSEAIKGKNDKPEESGKDSSTGDVTARDVSAPLSTPTAVVTPGVDSSVSNVLLAMMAAAIPVLVDLPKLAAMPPPSLKVGLENAKGNAATLSDGSTSASSDKSGSVAPTVSADVKSNPPNNPNTSLPISLVGAKTVPSEPEALPQRPLVTTIKNEVKAETSPGPDGRVTQTVGHQMIDGPLNVLGTANPPTGMGVALNSQRMKFAAEKNEVAGRTVQKLPHASPGADSAVSESGKIAVAADADLSGRKDNLFDPSQMMDISARTGVLETVSGSVVATALIPDNSATQAERLSHLVNQEVVMIRQSGANTLAVSLKLDPHTELFLQLTNHNGQIQASIRCERGNVGGLDGHWGNLQDSLASQNVQLLPLENNLRAPISIPATEASIPAEFNQSSQNPQPQLPQIPQDATPAGLAKEISMAKTKTKTLSPQGWESWA